MQQLTLRLYVMGGVVPDPLPEISVIVPTRNEAQNIPAFLESLPATVELIVVDASTDGTDALIRHLRPTRTRIIRSHARIAEARQLGAQAAHGRWLVFSDADVRFAPDYFDQLARAIHADACYGPKYATPAYPRYSQLFNAGQRALDRLGIAAASGSNMVIRRTALRAVGGFRRDLLVNEDTELMLRMRRRGFRVQYVQQLAVHALDDRRLDRGVARKLLHSLSRNLVILINLYIPLPQRWLRHDWGYWTLPDAHRTDL